MDPTDTDNTSATTDAPANDAGAATPAPAPAPADPPAPADALEAMTAALAPEGAADPAAPPAAGDDASKTAADGEGDPAASADGKQADGQPAAKDGEDDPFAMPEGLSENSKQRFETLARRARESDDWKARAEQWQQTVESTGASPEQFGQVLTYTRMVNSGDPSQLRQALAVLDEERAALARAIGEEVPGVDLLAGHADLIEKVENGDIDRATALEVARSRAVVASAQQQNASREQERIAQERHGSAVEGLNTLGAQLAAQDPHYAAKVEQMRSIMPVIAKLPPEQWKSEFMAVYNSLPATPVAAAPAPPASMQRMPASPQPLRATGGGAPSMQQQAASAQEAIEQALGLGT